MDPERRTRRHDVSPVEAIPSGWVSMRSVISPIREATVAMMELLASRRPDLLPVCLDMACNSPARFAVLELARDLGVREPRDLHLEVLKVVTDLDRLERRRSGWRHPRQVLHRPNIGGLLHFCRARIENVREADRRRRLEVLARKLQRAYDRERTRAWITDFIGTSGSTADGET